MTAAHIMERVRLRPVDLAAATLLAIAGLLGVLAAPHLPATMQVHWTVGDLPYAGIERLATPVALALLPLVGALTYGLLRGVTLLPGVRDGLADARSIYDVVSVGVVGTVVLVEVFLVLLNL